MKLMTDPASQTVCVNESSLSKNQSALWIYGIQPLDRKNHLQSARGKTNK